MHIPKINWKVRLKSKKFWFTFVPAVLYLLNMVANWFGFGFNIEVVQAEIMVFIEAMFAVLMIMGIIVDPTTSGLDDSERAMEY